MEKKVLLRHRHLDWQSLDEAARGHRVKRIHSYAAGPGALLKRRMCAAHNGFMSSRDVVAAPRRRLCIRGDLDVVGCCDEELSACDEVTLMRLLPKRAIDAPLPLLQR